VIDGQKAQGGFRLANRQGLAALNLKFHAGCLFMGLFQNKAVHPNDKNLNKMATDDGSAKIPRHSA